MQLPDCQHRLDGLGERLYSSLTLQAEKDQQQQSAQASSALVKIAAPALSLARLGPRVNTMSSVWLRSTVLINEALEGGIDKPVSYAYLCRPSCPEFSRPLQGYGLGSSAQLRASSVSIPEAMSESPEITITACVRLARHSPLGPAGVGVWLAYRSDGQTAAYLHTSGV